MSNRDGKAHIRTRIDWAAAKAFYVALEPHQRSFGVVSRQFGISDVSVGKHAKREGWAAAAAEADVAVHDAGMVRARRSRAERVAKVLALVDAVVDGFSDARLAEARVSDLPALVKLAELLEGEATDRVDIRKVQPVIVAFVTRVARHVPKAAQEEFAADLDWLEGELLAIESPESVAS